LHVAVTLASPFEGDRIPSVSFPRRIYISSNKCKIIEKEGNLSKELKKEILKKAVTYQQQAKAKKDKKD